MIFSEKFYFKVQATHFDKEEIWIWHICSVTRLGDLLHLGNFLKPLATINLPKFFVKVSKSIIFWATFIDNWRFSSGHIAHLAEQLLSTLGRSLSFKSNLITSWEQSYKRPTVINYNSSIALDAIYHSVWF